MRRFNYFTGILLIVAATGYAQVNLLTNPGAETEDLSGWGYDDQNCWGIGSGETAYEGNHYFKSAAVPMWTKRSQSISCVAAEFSESELDAEPQIFVSEQIRKYGDGPDHYYLKVELQDQNHNVITSWDSGDQNLNSDEWEMVSHEFTNYGSGLRYIYFEEGVKGAESSFQFTGTQLDGAWCGITAQEFDFDDGLRVHLEGQTDSTFTEYVFDNEYYTQDTLHLVLNNSFQDQVLIDEIYFSEPYDPTNEHPWFEAIELPPAGTVIDAGDEVPITIVSRPCSQIDETAELNFKYWCNGHLYFNRLWVKHNTLEDAGYPPNGNELFVSFESDITNHDGYFDSTAVILMSEIPIYFRNDAETMQYPIVIQDFTFGEESVFCAYGQSLPLILNYGEEAEFTASFTPHSTGDYFDDINVVWSVFQCDTFTSILHLTGSAYEADFPISPSNLVATAISTSQIDLEWQDNSTNENNFIVQYRFGTEGFFDAVDTLDANVTTYSHTNLPANTTYYYRVVSINEIGPSNPSNLVSATTLREGPEIVENFTATPADSSITLNWNARPISENVDYYALYRSEEYNFSPDSLSEALTTTPDTTFVDENLTLGKMYYYRVSAVDFDGNEGSYTEIVNSKTIFTDEDAPGNIIDLTTESHDGYITLNWTNPADADFAGVRICMSDVTYPATPTDGTYLGSQMGTPENESVFYAEVDTNGVNYYFTLFAFDGVPNYSSGENTSNMALDLDAPSLASNVSVQAGNGENYLYWTTPSNDDFAGTIVRCATDTFPEYTTGDLLVDDDSTENETAVEFVHQSLSNGTTYYYSVFTYDDNSNYSDAVEISAMPDDMISSPPTNLTANAGTGQVALSWTASDGEMIDGYTVYRSITNGFIPSSADSIGMAFMDATNFTDSDVTNGTTYFYRVAVITPGFASGFSGQAEARPCDETAPYYVNEMGYENNEMIDLDEELYLWFSEPLQSFDENNFSLTDDNGTDIQYRMESDENNQGHWITPIETFWPTGNGMHLEVNNYYDLCDNSGDFWTITLNTPEFQSPSEVWFWAIGTDIGVEVGWALSPSAQLPETYKIYRRLSGGEDGFEVIAEIGHYEDYREDGYIYEDFDVINNTFYDYYVTVVNENGIESPNKRDAEPGSENGSDYETTFPGITEDVVAEGFTDDNLMIWLQMPETMSQKSFTDNFSAMVMAHPYTNSGEGGDWDPEDFMHIPISNGDRLYIPVKITASLRCTNKGIGGNIAVGINPIGDYGELYNIGEVKYEPGYKLANEPPASWMVMLSEWINGYTPPVGPVIGTSVQIMDEFEDWFVTGQLWNIDASKIYWDEMLFGADLINHEYKSMGLVIDDISYRIDDRVDFFGEYNWWANPNFMVHISIDYNIYEYSFNVDEMMLMGVAKDKNAHGITKHNLKGLWKSMKKEEASFGIESGDYFKLCTSLLTNSLVEAMDQDIVGSFTRDFQFTLGDGQMSDLGSEGFANIGEDGVVMISDPPLEDMDLHGNGESLWDFAEDHGHSGSIGAQGSAITEVDLSSSSGGISGNSLGYSQEQWDDVDYVAVKFFGFSNVVDANTRIDDEIVELHFDNNLATTHIEQATYAPPVDVYAAYQLIGDIDAGSNFEALKGIGGYFHSKTILPREFLPDDKDEYFHIYCNIQDGKELLVAKWDMRFIGVEHSDINGDYLFSQDEETPIADSTFASKFFAWGDYNNDGLWDLLVHEPDGQNYKIKLYDRIQGFADVTNSVGLGDVCWSGANDGNVGNATWADFDNDNDQDLFIIGVGLFENESSNFTDITNSAMSGDLKNGKFAEWADYDGDGDLDLAKITQSGKAQLLLNNDGVFELDTTNNEILDMVESATATCLSWVDVENDGDLDLYIGTNSNNENNYLFLMEQMGEESGFIRFTNTHMYSVQGNFDTNNAIWIDYDNDADQDLYLANNGACRLFQNNSDTLGVQFNEIQDELFWDQADYNYLRLHRDATFGDFDSDGDLDTYLLGASPDSGEGQNKLFLNSGDNNWTELGIQPPISTGDFKTKIAAWVDYNNMHGLDLFITDNELGNVAYTNTQENTRLLKVQCVPISGAKFAPGAKVRLYDMSENLLASRVIGLGTGGFSQEAPEALFGVELNAEYKVEVEFPSGNIVNWVDTPDLLSGVEGSGQPLEVYESWDASVERLFAWDNIGFMGEGAGCAWGDFDGDGDLDLFFGNESGPAQLYLADGSDLIDGTMEANLGNIIGVQGVAVADYENDGDLDIVITRGSVLGSGFIKVLTNNGSGYFSEHQLVGNHAEMAQWVDFDLDGDLDLSVVDFDMHTIYRNDGLIWTPASVNFIDLLGGETPIWNIVWNDINNDRYPDALINAIGISTIAVNNNGESFIRQDLLSSVYENWRSGCFGDFNNDGFMDVYVSNNYHGTPVGANYGYVFWNDNGTFSNSNNTQFPFDETNAFNLNSFAKDFDNDGDVDILEISDGQHNFLHKNNGEGSFIHIKDPEGPGSYISPWSASAGDFNNDGDIDVFVSNNNSVILGSSRLIQNNTNNAGWIKVRLVGASPNLSAVGSMVRIYEDGHSGDDDYLVGMRYINSGETGWSTNALEANFGVEPGDYDIEVTFPSGSVVTEDVTISRGQTVVIYEEQETDDETPVTVDSVSPQNSEDDVAVNSMVIVDFSKTIDESTLNEETFILSIPDVVRQDNEDKELLSLSLANRENIALPRKSNDKLATSEKNTKRNLINWNYEEEGLTSSKVYSRGTVSGVLNYYEDLKRIIFFPSETYPENIVITVTITTGLMDSDGLHLDGNGNGNADGSPSDDYSWSFTTTESQNNPPIADDIAVETDEDVEIEITLTGSDADGDELAFAVQTQPENGVLSGDVPNLTYTPNADYNGADSFTYTANDGTVDSELATVTITVNAVNDAPIADDIAVTTDEDVAVEITLTGSDADGDELTFEVVDAPTNGVYADGVYTPNLNFNGIDSFTFVVNDNVEPSTILVSRLGKRGKENTSPNSRDLSEVATVTITVNAVPDYGCIDDTACNFNELADTDDGSCEYAEEYYDCAGNCLNDIDEDGVCDELEIAGCTDELACNFDELATEDDGNCYYESTLTCYEDIDADGYYNQTQDYTACDAVCSDLGETWSADAGGGEEIYGCSDPEAGNYDDTVTEDDGSCEYAITQTIPLATGWNWFSINVDAYDMSLDNVFYSLGENATLIKNQTGFATYYAEFGWYGLDAIYVTSMYMIQMTTSADLVFEGNAVDYQNTPIALSSGWNWVGYLPQTLNNLESALASIGENAFLIKSQTEFATYYEGFGWYGMNSLNPGDGYMINMNASATLIYGIPDGLVRNDEASIDFHWSVNPHQFEHNMTITADVEIDGIQISEDDQLGVFVNGECRGTAVPTYFPLTDSYTINLMTYGENGDELSFRVYQSETNTEIEVLDNLTFEINGIIGNDIDPILLRAVVIPDEYSLSQNYPNPFNPSTTISYQLPAPGSVLLAIYNVNGQLIEELVSSMQEAGYHQITWDADNQPSGLYFVRMAAGDYVGTQKVLLLK